MSNGRRLAARRRLSGGLRRNERAVPRRGAGRRDGDAPSTNPPTGSTRPILKSLDGVDRALIRAATNEVNKLERRMTFLATTASVTPFIGLFGTVVGIMIAFQRIGATGSTNLAVVGARHQRSAHCHGRGAVRGHSRARVLQPLHASREGILGGDGRLRAGISEHRGAEFYIAQTQLTPHQSRCPRSCPRRPTPAAATSAAAAWRPRSPKSTSSRWST